MFFRKTIDRDNINLILQECGASLYVEACEITDDGQVIVSLIAHAGQIGVMETLRQQVEARLRSAKNVRQAIVVLTSEKPAPVMPEMKKHASPDTKRLELPHIKKIIAVASGKGGVGKSTVAANLAVALSRAGKKVGLMDGDIYGPSVPRLMGAEHKKPDFSENKKLIPFEKHGITFMSMGFLVAEEAPMIWRGPMIQSAITQLLKDVEWGELDVLVIDLPPGTGDAQLTLAQKVPVTGAVIVSTPQDLALIDARKAIEMFKKMSVPIIGMIENMSYHICANCGHTDHIFGHGGARAQAAMYDIPFLGDIPLNTDIRTASDAGQPLSIPVLEEIYGTIVRETGI